MCCGNVIHRSPVIARALPAAILPSFTLPPPSPSPYAGIIFNTREVEEYAVVVEYSPLSVCGYTFSYPHRGEGCCG